MKMLTELDYLKHRVAALEEFLKTHFGVICNSLPPYEAYYIKSEELEKEESN